MFRCRRTRSRPRRPLTAIPRSARDPGNDPSLDRAAVRISRSSQGENEYQEDKYLAPSRRDQEKVTPLPQGEPGLPPFRGAPNGGGSSGGTARGAPHRERGRGGPRAAAARGSPPGPGPAGPRAEAGSAAGNRIPEPTLVPRDDLRDRSQDPHPEIDIGTRPRRPLKPRQDPAGAAGAADAAPRPGPAKTFPRPSKDPPLPTRSSMGGLARPGPERPPGPPAAVAAAEAAPGAGGRGG